MAVAALLFLGQTLIGGGVAHYRADPGSFYGIDLVGFLPSNLLRTWHLQLAILWIATAYVGGALFVAGMLGRSEPAGQRRAIHLLFAALVVVAVGSLLGEWAGILQWLGKPGSGSATRAGNISRSAASGRYCSPSAWSSGSPAVARRGAGAARSGAARSHHLLPDRRGGDPGVLSAGAVLRRHHPFHVVDTWRFWIIHLWVEGFFEFFVTVIVAIIFYELGLVKRITALRVIYLDAILISAAG